MTRICEVCGRVEDVNHPEHPYDILDVCADCTIDAIHPAVETDRLQ